MSYEEPEGEDRFPSRIDWICLVLFALAMILAVIGAHL